MAHVTGNNQFNIFFPQGKKNQFLFNYLYRPNCNANDGRSKFRHVSHFSTFDCSGSGFIALCKLLMIFQCGQGMGIALGTRESLVTGI
jgi:hypothetical protein